jgi:molybdopterin molybdotransferase
LIEIVDALKLIDEKIKFHGKTQMVGLFDAVGKILAADIICTRALPSFNNSAMDGYGVKLADSGKIVEIKGAVFAGDLPDMNPQDGIAIKIMTGAPVPSGVEAVVPFEDTKLLDSGKLQLPENIKPSANIRLRGEEINEGEILAKCGEKITPSLVGLLASQGIMTINVASKPKVGIISTGSEIVEPWESVKEHQIYNSNAPLLHASCMLLGCDTEYIKLIADNYEATKEFLSNLKGYDLLITSGGISAGEADYIIKAFKANGFNSSFEKVNIKPGKPTVFGFLSITAVLALPGNPLAAAVNFYLFGYPIIAKLNGQKNFWPQIVRVKNAEEFKIKNARSNQILGRIENGEFVAFKGGKYGSGMLMPMKSSTAFVILNAGSGVVEKGAELNVILLDENGSSSLGDLISNA